MIPAAELKATKKEQAVEVASVEKEAAKDDEVPKFTKVITGKGDGLNFPKKGDSVSVWYTGTLTNGKVFDTNKTAPKRGKKPQPLKFKRIL